MSEAAARTRDAPDPPRRPPPPCYAALDLGTNNCRLLIAAPARGGGFRVVDSFSRIVRLGEGLSRTGRLDPAACDRAAAALATCAERIARRGAVRTRAVATQACRIAADGAAFVARIRAETGLELEVITPEEEARLAVAGCRALFDPAAEAALVLDVGGGSTELSWVDLADGGRVRAWLSMPIGVVGLAERFPEPRPATTAWYDAMVAHVAAALSAFPDGAALAQVFADGHGHVVGTSGAITSLAGIHLGLPRYDRARVDGLWMTPAECKAAAARLIAVTPAERAGEPCIGPDRADLVLAGAAILHAVLARWPCARLRVADRGLREGLLLEMMAARGPGARRRRRRPRGSAA
ncbi:MAG: Ppx/GppA family phosphatase [Caulobacteraceae bacterium]|nr:Ppx/GppA family phosphatase [Caulobacter sp.]